MKKEVETKKVRDLKTNEEKEISRIKIIPDEGKCFQNKRTGHRFIHTFTKKGLPVYVRKEEQIDAIYNEVDLPSVEELEKDRQERLNKLFRREEKVESKEEE